MCNSRFSSCLSFASFQRLWRLRNYCKIILFSQQRSSCAFIEEIQFQLSTSTWNETCFQLAHPYTCSLIPSGFSKSSTQQHRATTAAASKLNSNWKSSSEKSFYSMELNNAPNPTKKKSCYQLNPIFMVISQRLAPLNNSMRNRLFDCRTRVLARRARHRRDFVSDWVVCQVESA